MKNSRLKFRAYVKEKNKMYPVYSLDLSHVSDYFATIADCGNLDCGMCHEYYKREEVEIMQYTGFKDKNGIEIYEHDFVKYIGRNLSNAFGGKGEAWETKVELVRWFKYGWIIPMGFVKEIEVIGNIYDNPELSRCENE